VLLFCYSIITKGDDFMGITKYIKSKKVFDLMPFMTVYLTIVELMRDGYLQSDIFVVDKDV
jgi:hypothetical protein